MSESSLILFIFLIVVMLFLILLFTSSESVRNEIFQSIAIIIAAGSLIITVLSLSLTKKAVQQTEKTLKITEIEQQIRDLERRLDLFYYPVYDFQNSTTGIGPGELNFKKADFNRAVSFRYLAIEKETRKRLEEFLIKKGKNEKDTEELKNLLKNDITKCEENIEKLRKLIN